MCERCAELEEEISYLKSELGLQNSYDAERKIRDAVFARMKEIPGSRGATGVARLLSVLYAARGKPVVVWQVLERMGSHSSECGKLVAVQVCHARKVFGKDVIGNIWARGYYLTPTGMETVRALMEQVV